MDGNVITAIEQAEMASAAPRTDEAVLADDAVNARKRLSQRAADAFVGSQDRVGGEPASTNPTLLNL